MPKIQENCGCRVVLVEMERLVVHFWSPRHSFGALVPAISRQTAQYIGIQEECHIQTS